MLSVVLSIVLVEVNARNFYSVKVLSDRVVVCEDCAEVVKVDVAHILDAKIVEN